jgi:6-phosphogluconolactonase (cycloisomerase 2 family)
LSAFVLLSRIVSTAQWIDDPGVCASGSRPFKLTFDPTGQFAYIPDNGFSNVYGFSVNATTGALAALESSPILAGNQPAWVVIDPSGKFANVSDRLGDVGSPFSFANASGVLTPLAPGTVSGVNFPWQILFDPSGQIMYVLNEGGGSVTTFATNQDGTLTSFGSVATGNTPWSFAIVPGS